MRMIFDKKCYEMKDVIKYVENTMQGKETPRPESNYGVHS